MAPGQEVRILKRGCLVFFHTDEDSFREPIFRASFVRVCFVVYHLVSLDESILSVQRGCVPGYLQAGG